MIVSFFRPSIIYYKHKQGCSGAWVVLKILSRESQVFIQGPSITECLPIPVPA